MRLAFKAIIAAVILVLNMAAPVAAGPLEDGTAAYGKKDYATARRLVIPLAKQGKAEAQYILGMMYGNGYGVPQDYAEAVKWYRLAADQGIARAQFVLGVMHAVGQGVPQDYAEAAKWYRFAANQGIAAAQYNLGPMYEHGRGVPQDYVSAHMWFNLAAAQGDKNAAKNRDSVVSLMTPAQITEAQKLAREWKPTR